MEQINADATDFARQVIDHLDLDALETITEHAISHLEQVREKTRQEELVALNSLAAKHGATLVWPKEKKLSRSRSQRKRVAALPAKFIDPANPANRWSGRGRQPVWLQQYVAQGRTPSEFMTS